MTESPTGIDPETGLARLPKGYHWEVTEGTYRDGPIFYLKIMGEVVETTYHKPWFKPAYTTDKITHEVIYSGYVWECGEYGYSTGFAKYLTPENLLFSTCREMEKHFEEKKEKDEIAAHREASKALLGSYPPKSINRKETN